jgi:hypothetical protein
MTTNTTNTTNTTTRPTVTAVRTWDGDKATVTVTIDGVAQRPQRGKRAANAEAVVIIDWIPADYGYAVAISGSFEQAQRTARSYTPAKNAHGAFAVRITEEK